MRGERRPGAAVIEHDLEKWMSEMIVGGSWCAIGRGYLAFDDGGHDFDDEFGNLAAGGANRRRVVGRDNAVVRVLSNVH
jgi:hypothetical protein